MLEPLYAVETIDLTKYFHHGGAKALKNVNLQIRHGEIVALLGPNGAGKTTLLKILSTLVLPTSGTAYVKGYEIVRCEDDVKKSIGLVTGEERSFYWRLTGRQNLEFFAALYGLRPDEAKPRIDALLEQLDLSAAADNMFYSYSSGMKQKLALVRGLLCNPAVLFLDEPTKSVDVMTARDLRGFIKET